MFPFNSDSRIRRCQRSWALTAVLLAACIAPGPIQAQTCGGNSTVDILGAQTAASARAFLAQLQTAVRSNNKDQIAAMVNYPLLVLRSGARNHVRRKDAFLARYDRLFTPIVRHAILHQTAQCLFGNSSGAMVGNGQVWFQEQTAGEWKIITINESTRGH